MQAHCSNFSRERTRSVSTRAQLACFSRERTRSVSNASAVSRAVIIASGTVCAHAHLARTEDISDNVESTSNIVKKNPRVQQPSSPSEQVGESTKQRTASQHAYRLLLSQLGLKEEYSMVSFLKLMFASCHTAAIATNAIPMLNHSTIWYRSRSSWHGTSLLILGLLVGFRQMRGLIIGGLGAGGLEAVGGKGTEERMGGTRMQEGCRMELRTTSKSRRVQEKRPKQFPGRIHTDERPCTAHKQTAEIHTNELD
jgi:hypothetical protein